MGATDPQLMKALVEQLQIFDAFYDYNYQVRLKFLHKFTKVIDQPFIQALCPDAVDCGSFGVRSVIAPTLNAIVYAVQNLAEVIKNVGYIVIR